MSGVFLSYRHSDEPGYVGRLADDLKKALGDIIFRDVDSIDGGSQWKLELQKRVSESQIVIAVIGQRWQSILSEQNPIDDYIRFELNLAYKHAIPIIPVVIQDTEFDHKQDLGDLNWLLDLQFFELSDRQTRWSSDVDKLIEHIVASTSLERVESAIRKSPEFEHQSIAASGNVNIHIGETNHASTKGEKRHKKTLIVALIGAGATVLAALVAIAPQLLDHAPTPGNTQPEQSALNPESRKMSHLSL